MTVKTSSADVKSKSLRLLRNFSVSFCLLGIGASLPFLLASHQEDQAHPAQSEVLSCVSSPEVPESVAFAGENVDLTRSDLRERLDRELITITYMHTNSQLMLKRANRLFPVIEPILKANGLPDDFKYLMAIESSVDILARSPAGAAGLWQFMPVTAKEHGLEVNDQVDERYNIEKETVAACRYLKGAYQKYGDWLTVAASYNAGQGRISQQLTRQQATHAFDLWLVPETSRYMFRILAAKLFFENPQRYGFLLRKENLYPQVHGQTVTVSGPVSSWPDYARSYGLNYYQLRNANPWIRDIKLDNRGGKSYKVFIPDAASLHYNPKETQAYSAAWVVDQ